MASNHGRTSRGRYRIQAVSEMTGVSAPTLRAWERRYQIPRPTRTASAYRLYTDADVEQVRRMRELCQAGHSAAEAARMVQQAGVEQVQEALNDPLEIVRASILAAAEDYDAAALQETLHQLMSMGHAAAVYEEIVSPVMREVGERWRCGTLSIGQEHMVTTLVETTLRNMLQLVQAVDATRSVVLGCYASEEHTIGLYGAGLRFAGWGYRVIMMGPSLPPNALQEAVTSLRPDVVGLSRVVAEAPPDDDGLTAAYAQACSQIPWVVGGSGAPAVSERVLQHNGLLANVPFDLLRHQLDAARRPIK